MREDGISAESVEKLRKKMGFSPKCTMYIHWDKRISLIELADASTSSDVLIVLRETLKPGIQFR